MRRLALRLALVSALGLCSWAGIGAAQAAPGSPYGSHSSAQADAAADIPYHRPVDVERASFALLQKQALAAMEALREEIATLTALRDAQAALLALQLESTTTGAYPHALSAALCEDPAIGAWCPLLPTTFGAPDAPSGEDTSSGGDTPSGGGKEDGHDRD